MLVLVLVLVLTLVLVPVFRRGYVSGARQGLGDSKRVISLAEGRAGRLAGFLNESCVSGVLRPD